MTGKFRWFKWVGLAAFGSLVLGACAPAGPISGVGSPRAGGRITIGSWQEPDTLLSAGIIDSVGHTYAAVNPVMEGLLQVKAAADVPKNPKNADYWAPQLATNVPTVENGDVKIQGTKMDVTWKLRRNVKWHDGVPFTSRDVKATFEFWWLKFKEKNPSPVLQSTGWDLVESVETPDDFTAVVHWKTLFGPYLSFGTGPYGILPEHLLTLTWAKSGDITKEKLDINIPGGFKGKDTWDKWLVGTGPFMFREWLTGERMTLVKNPTWWGDHKAYLDEITIKFEPDVTTQLTDLKTNTIDMGWDFRTAMLSPLSHLEQVLTVVLPESGAEHIDLNLHNKFLRDKAVRQAILMGLDRQKIVDTLLEGKTLVPPDSWLCLGTGAWCQDSSAKTTRYSVEQAKKLLDDGGYKVPDPKTQKALSDKCGKGFRANSAGDCLELSLVTTAGIPLREQQQVVIASDLQLIGIRVKQPFNYNPRTGKFFGAYQNQGTLYTHQFDMAMYTNAYVTPAEPDSYFSGYVSNQIPMDANGGQGQNSTFTSDPRVDKAFNDGRTKVGQNERKQAYVEAQKALADILPDIPLYQQVHVSAHHKKLQGYKGNEFFWANNAQDWYLSS